MKLDKIEQGILGGMILDPSYFIKNLPNYFDVNTFENDIHKKMFSYIADKVFNESVKEIDCIDLHDKTGARISYIGELMDVFWENNAYLNFKDNLNIWLKESKVKADTTKLKQDLDNGIITDNDYYQEMKLMVEEYERGSQEIKPSLTDKEICEKYVNEYSEKDAQTFLTGLGLDDSYKFRRQEVTVIGALNKIGKSLFALFLAMKFSKEGSVLYVSTEMGETDYAERSMAHKTALNSEKIRDKKLNAEEIEILRQGLIGNKDNVYFECYTRKLSDIEKRVSMIRPDVLIIDHLHDLHNPDGIKDEEEGIAANMRNSKLLSIKHNMVVVMMGQLSRQAEGKEDLFSYMLRGSGVIEQVADGVILIKRDIKTQKDSATFRIDRSRHGQSGIDINVRCVFATANFY
jgi:replicative DNA helicase